MNCWYKKILTSQITKFRETGVRCLAGKCEFNLQRPTQYISQLNITNKIQSSSVVTTMLFSSQVNKFWSMTHTLASSRNSVSFRWAFLFHGSHSHELATSCNKLGRQHRFEFVGCSVGGDRSQTANGKAFQTAGQLPGNCKDHIVVASHHRYTTVTVFVILN